MNGYPFDNTLGQKDRKLPWSGQLEAALREKWGDDFLADLPALWYESGEKTPGIRVTYMDEMTGLVRTCLLYTSGLFATNPSAVPILIC